MENTGAAGCRTYTTLRAPARAEFTEKRSRFIASVSPAAEMAEAEAFWAAVRAEFRGARHNAFAARTLLPAALAGGAEGPGTGEETGGEGAAERCATERCSDDGEPQGTAGLPALTLLRRRGVTGAAVVVTRYFGGILLGAPGLLRAYGHAASLALDAAALVTMRRCVRLRVRCPYPLYAQVEALTRGAGRVESRDFGEDAVLCAAVPEERAPAFSAALTGLSAGSVEAVPDGALYVPASELPEDM